MQKRFESKQQIQKTKTSFAKTNSTIFCNFGFSIDAINPINSMRRKVLPARLRNDHLPEKRSFTHEFAEAGTLILVPLKKKKQNKQNSEYGHIRQPASQNCQWRNIFGVQKIKNNFCFFTSFFAGFTLCAMSVVVLICRSYLPFFFKGFLKWNILRIFILIFFLS